MNTNTNNPNKKIQYHSKRGFVDSKSVNDYVKLVNKLLFQLGFWDENKADERFPMMGHLDAELRLIPIELLNDDHHPDLIEGGWDESPLIDTLKAMQSAEYSCYQDIEEHGFFLGKNGDEVSHDIDEIIVYKDDVSCELHGFEDMTVKCFKAVEVPCVI